MNAVIKFADEINTANKEKEGFWTLEQIGDDEKKVIGNAARYSSRSISPMCAFFGGITA